MLIPGWRRCRRPCAHGAGGEQTAAVTLDARYRGEDLLAPLRIRRGQRLDLAAIMKGLVDAALACGRIGCLLRRNPFQQRAELIAQILRAGRPGEQEALRLPDIDHAARAAQPGQELKTILTVGDGRGEVKAGALICDLEAAGIKVRPAPVELGFEAGMDAVLILDCDAGAAMDKRNREPVRIRVLDPLGIGGASLGLGAMLRRRGFGA